MFQQILQYSKTLKLQVTLLTFLANWPYARIIFEQWASESVPLMGVLKVNI